MRAITAQFKFAAMIDAIALGFADDERIPNLLETPDVRRTNRRYALVRKAAASTVGGLSGVLIAAGLYFAWGWHEAAADAALKEKQLAAITKPLSPAMLRNEAAKLASLERDGAELLKKRRFAALMAGVAAIRGDDIFITGITLTDAASAPDARSNRRADSRACWDSVQGTSRRTRDTGAGEATPAQSLAAWQEFARQYFPALAQRPAVVHGGGVLLPVAFPQTGLHVLRAGVFVGSVQKGRFVPEHHLFTAFGAQCTNREELALADPRVVEYLSGREIAAATAADGWCCVTVDGFPLGGGKESAGRVKSHYTKARRQL